MTATGIKMTADELLRLPDNGMRRELIAGELHEMPPAGGDHGYVGARARTQRLTRRAKNSIHNPSPPGLRAVGLAHQEGDQGADGSSGQGLSTQSLRSRRAFAYTP